MKKILITTILTLSILSCKAQIIPIEDIIYYKVNELDLPDNTTYVKDINHLLDQFIGTWTGTYNNRNYEIIIMPFTDYDEYDEVSRDILLMRYKITENGLNGNEITIIDTTNLPNDNYLVNKGWLIEDMNKYYFNYSGIDNICGQFGEIVIQTINNNTQIRLLLLLGYDMVLPEDNCPEDVEQLFPTQTNMFLTKQ